MDDAEDDYSEVRTLITHVKNILLAPLHLALSPALLRTYLRTILILLTSMTLFAIAVVAYTSFYVAYIPVQGISVPVYLQFDTDRGGVGLEPEKRPGHPYGVAGVDGLVARQKYDVVVEMVVPRSRKNLEQGNWMVGVEMRAPSTATEASTKGLLGWDGEDGDLYGGHRSTAQSAATAEKLTVLARSRRPAILTYRSWTTEHAYRALRLPLYMLGWGQESETVSIPVIESVEFRKGWRNIPTSLRLDTRSTTPLEVYKVVVKFVARLEGLRWVMYTHRLGSFIVFTSLFWGVEMGLVLFTWAIFALFFGGGPADEDSEERKRQAIKTEPDAGVATPRTDPYDSAPSTPRSDTSRTFPTLSGQQPLHYSSGEGKVKKERGETPRLKDLPFKTEAEADDEDEDEDEDFFMEEPNTAAGAMTDSGIGTSMESGIEGRGLVRRKSNGSVRWDGTRCG